MALGDVILACLTERPMTGCALAKTFDARSASSGRPPADLSRALKTARSRPCSGPRGGAVGQAQQAGLHPHIRGQSRAETLGGKAEQPAFDQGRSAGAAVCARQRRHRPAARRPDGATGAPPRSFRPLRAHFERALPPKAPHRPRISANCSDCASAFATSARLRNGAKRPSMPCPPSPTGPTSCRSRPARATRGRLSHPEHSGRR